MELNRLPLAFFRQSAALSTTPAILKTVDLPACKRGTGIQTGINEALV